MTLKAIRVAWKPWNELKLTLAHHHHHVVLVARISLILSRHFSLSFIALGRSSGQRPVSSHSCWMYVRAGRPAFARPCVGVHKSTSLMSSSLLPQQCPACLVRLTWIVFVIGGRTIGVLWGVAARTCSRHWIISSLLLILGLLRVKVPVRDKSIDQ